ncbi:MAG: hypothetical protein PHE55_04705 [Methylococcaceae bacterium]|nr:hypothetical protein [Methylococcaceae bacterium]
MFTSKRDCISPVAMSGMYTPAAFWIDTHAEPYEENDAEHGRYVSYFAEQASKARALAELIQAVPSSLWMIRGLDIATDECCGNTRSP